MWRQENQPPRPAAGFLSVPLFNQKKRNRIPLTSAPSENEFFSHREYMEGSSAALLSTSDTYGCYQVSGPSSGVSQTEQNRPALPSSTPYQQYDSKRAAPGPALAVRHYAPIPHPYKVGGTSSPMGQPSHTGRQMQSCVNPRQSDRQTPFISEAAQNNTTHIAYSQKNQQSLYRSSSPTHQYSQQSRSLPALGPLPNKPSAHSVQPQNKSWKFTNSFGPQKPTFEKKSPANGPQTPRQTRSQQETFQSKPSYEISLRILTAVIDGMRHWSQFKDKVPYLFEIFATLDSAVTLGHHGAKNFLMRDGKEVVQCVFYENEQELPRLIRGQIHRCVGNYDSSRDVLTCVSVRPGLTSEQRNAQEAVKACDVEMRALVKTLHEV